jgi:hypothetical protein
LSDGHEDDKPTTSTALIRLRKAVVNGLAEESPAPPPIVFGRPSAPGFSNTRRNELDDEERDATEQPSGCVAVFALVVVVVLWTVVMIYSC